MVSVSVSDAARLVARAGGVGDGWALLPEGSTLEEGDGFLHPHSEVGWIDYVCRPDLFRREREYVHSGWPWRRLVDTARL